MQEKALQREVEYQNKKLLMNEMASKASKFNEEDSLLQLVTKHNQKK